MELALRGGQGPRFYSPFDEAGSDEEVGDGATTAPTVTVGDRQFDRGSDRWAPMEPSQPEGQPREGQAG